MGSNTFQRDNKLQTRQSTRPVKPFYIFCPAPLGRDYRTGVGCFLLLNWGVADSIRVKPI
jgi:hypothetical protein